MNKIARVFIIMTAIILFCPQSGQADIVYIKNGDKLFGTIPSPSFSVQTTYGKITVKNDFLRSLVFENRSVGRWILRTVNNDQFSGSWIESGIELIQDNGERKVLAKENIRRIRREIEGQISKSMNRNRNQQVFFDFIGNRKQDSADELCDRQSIAGSMRQDEE